MTITPYLYISARACLVYTPWNTGGTGLIYVYIYPTGEYSIINSVKHKHDNLDEDPSRQT